MPQMKPMNWMLLFILTNIMLLMMNIMLFYMKKINKNNNMKLYNKTFLNWKW